jgi:dTDP-4-dehydrorhamnose 3,5-epimerase
MFALHATSIDGCFEVQPKILDDHRGRFVKVFHAGAFADLGLADNFSEEYYSHSRNRVLRGMHFQTPPADHIKMVYCVTGAVFDVVVDLRVGSPTFGHAQSFALSADKGNFLYIPKGLAHGFCVTSATATLVYKVTSVYSPEHDTGVLWSSINVTWPISDPIVSERDAHFLPLSQFQSPFNYD